MEELTHTAAAGWHSAVQECEGHVVSANSVLVQERATDLTLTKDRFPG